MARSKDNARTTAEDLYIYLSYTQKEIAERVGVSERTVSNWKHKYEWDVRKKARSRTKAALQGLGEELGVLFLEQQIKKAHAQGEDAEIKPGDIDALNKLGTALQKIAGSDTPEMYMTVFDAFMDWLRSRNLQLAKELSDYTREFLVAKVKQDKGVEL